MSSDLDIVSFLSCRILSDYDDLDWRDFRRQDESFVVAVHHDEAL